MRVVLSSTSLLVAMALRINGVAFAACITRSASPAVACVALPHRAPYGLSIYLTLETPLLYSANTWGNRRSHMAYKVHRRHTCGSYRAARLVSSVLIFSRASGLISAHGARTFHAVHLF
ncbi:hypothetical protein C8R44DRAFT_780817 [Mycena epipterygia]|nr:hypothetical protein C8R44DRAFT_780817 [Mycena epipterygia]